MDLYKKKSLKFDSVGLSGNLRGVERSTTRAALRHSRFSLLRHLDNEDETEEVIGKTCKGETEEKVENKDGFRRIPTLGTQGRSNLKAPVSRLEMLKKWKEEKEMKRQQELKNKKPTFKVGLLPPVAPKLLPFERSTNTSNKSETTVQQSSSIRAPTSSSKNIKSSSIKESKIQIPARKLPVPMNTNQKIPSLGSSNQKLKQENSLQAATKSRMIPKNTSNTKEVSIKESRLQAPTKPQSVSKNTSATTREVNNKLTSSTVSKPQSRILKPQQTISSGASRIAQKKVPESKPTPLGSNIQVPNQSRSNLPKSSFVSNNQKKLGNAGKILEKPDTSKQLKPTGISRNIGLLSKVQTKNASKIGIPPKASSKHITFRCELSHIEPAEEKSLPQKGYRFCPLNETSFSFLEEGGITAIFSKLRAGTARTSTPKRADIQQSAEAEEISCSLSKDSPKNEVFESQEANSSFNESYHLASANFPDAVEVKEREACVPVSKVAEELKNVTVEQNTDDLHKKEMPEVNEFSEETNVSEICSGRKLESVSPVEDSLPAVENIITMKKIEDKFLGTQQTNVCPKPNLVVNLLEDSLPVLKDSPLLKAGTQKCDIPPKPNLVKNLLEESLSILKDSPLLKAAATESLPQKQDDFFKKPYPVKLLEERFPVFEAKCMPLNPETTSEVSQPQKTDLLSDELSVKLECSEFKTEESGASLDFPKKELSSENPISQAPDTHLPSEERSPLLPIKVESNNAELQKEPTEEDSIISRRKTRNSDARTRSFRRSEMPALESISESTESGSLPESQPRPRKSKKSVVPKDFTPRRSTRLARLSSLDSEEENLFNVRPSFCEMSPDLENGSFSTKEITYDFDNLHLESGPSKEAEPLPQRPSTRKGKVSLLYTPPTNGRVSTLRKSIRGDLMSFSPDV